MESTYRRNIYLWEMYICSSYRTSHNIEPSLSRLPYDFLIPNNNKLCNHERFYFFPFSDSWEGQIDILISQATWVSRRSRCYLRIYCDLIMDKGHGLFRVLLQLILNKKSGIQRMDTNWPFPECMLCLVVIVCRIHIMYVLILLPDQNGAK